jgi:hypothetical protein
MIAPRYVMFSGPPQAAARAILIADGARINAAHRTTLIRTTQ